MNYLIVAAHPDDEVLGAGAAIHKLTGKGNAVDICIMSAEAKARSCGSKEDELSSNMEVSSAILGIRSMYKASFRNIEMNTEPHLHLVRFIEETLLASKADIVITHHPSDTNNDHLHTSMACQEAVRLFQRRDDVKPLKELWYMEVPSSTEWSVNSAMNRFMPNTFIEVGKESLDAKLRALSAYRGVMRAYPHPRSREALEGLAAYRGAQSGCCYAEAFECVLRRITYDR